MKHLNNLLCTFGGSNSTQSVSHIGTLLKLLIDMHKTEAFRRITSFIDNETNFWHYLHVYNTLNRFSSRAHLTRMSWLHCLQLPRRYHERMIPDGFISQMPTSKWQIICKKLHKLSILIILLGIVVTTAHLVNQSNSYALQSVLAKYHESLQKFDMFQFLQLFIWFALSVTLGRSFRFIIASNCDCRNHFMSL